MDRFLLLLTTLSIILTQLGVAVSQYVVISHATSPAETYWRTVLPDTTMPNAIQELLHQDVNQGEDTPMDNNEAAVKLNNNIAGQYGDAATKLNNNIADQYGDAATKLNSNIADQYGDAATKLNSYRAIYGDAATKLNSYKAIYGDAATKLHSYDAAATKPRRFFTNNYKASVARPHGYGAAGHGSHGYIAVHGDSTTMTHGYTAATEDAPERHGYIAGGVGDATKPQGYGGVAESQGYIGVSGTRGYIRVAGGAEKSLGYTGVAGGGEEKPQGYTGVGGGAANNHGYIGGVTGGAPAKPHGYIGADATQKSHGYIGVAGGVEKQTGYIGVAGGAAKPQGYTGVASGVEKGYTGVASGVEKPQGYTRAAKSHGYTDVAGGKDRSHGYIGVAASGGATAKPHGYIGVTGGAAKPHGYTGVASGVEKPQGYTRAAKSHGYTDVAGGTAAKSHGYIGGVTGGEAAKSHGYIGGVAGGAAAKSQGYIAADVAGGEAKPQGYIETTTTKTNGYITATDEQSAKGYSKIYAAATTGNTDNIGKNGYISTTTNDVARPHSYGVATEVENPQGYEVASDQVAKPQGYIAAGNGYISAKAASSSNHDDDPRETLNFVGKDLYQGSAMAMRFVRTTTGATFLAREEADSIPFSTSTLPDILAIFSVNPNTIQAEKMRTTLQGCELPPDAGEVKRCVASLESMLEFSLSTLGTSNVHVLETRVGEELGAPMQHYRIASFAMVGSEFVACHIMPFAYPVYFCHRPPPLAEAYTVALVGEDGVRVEATAVCHTMTPGTDAMCHFLPQGDLIWMPNVYNSES